MKWKEFLKPDWGKIVIFIVLILLSLLFPSNIALINPIMYFIWTFTGIPCPGGFCDRGLRPFIVGLFFTVLFYLISCLIIWIYGKVKKK